ncbi:LLM class flavin-dependent oxidoreductase [Nocardia terpenica]|uniref:Monooxygenase n=1 Tax=Nocardia terpenica TaxID=455432 RepID=A0A0U1YZC7_9NOCA|nr:LLM class flavin-dependent oxidoreductase [Nocardia terpenica]AJO72768.1 Monooxygenase [Nocardia terpenica]KZM75386.1 xenobiotic compound monooxygenase A subunit [Nocardia terpenica]MBF6063777.1 LLM class flavin-dependent oxidoreductase [Nocardia terpenica]MBF6107153.1 LLM class flavin-dependent oxidoreductase [Nocardia terpenica]MBF6114326.1 LLM class flavin-dependent oxidoreductase [Nocardia terpenica]
MSTKRAMHLGLMFWATGTHSAGWRHPDARGDAAYDIGLIQEVSRTVERAKFDFVFLGDRLATDPALQHSNPAQISRLEPFVTATAIAAATTHIGIVVTANPTYSDPYGIARMLASLDHISGGRAAWNLVTGADPAAALNFGRDAHWETDKRYDWAEETLRVVRDLWDGGDRAIGHRGTYFSVDGPLDVPRPPQGHVVLLSAGTSDRSRELGASRCDMVFAGPQPTLAARQAYYADIKERAARHGRADQVTVVPGLTPIVAPTTEEAVRLHDELNALLVLDPEEEVTDLVRAGGLGEGYKRNRACASRAFGIDIRGCRLDDVVPAEQLAAVSEEGARRLAEITRLTRRTADGPERITYADLVHGTPAQLSHVVVGNPEEVADMMQEWFEGDMADGFNIYPAYVPGSITAFTELVVPELQRRGLFRKDYHGRMLRDHLGLHG